LNETAEIAGGAAALAAPPAEPAFAEPARLTSRDVLRLLPRAWPFIRPYKHHLLYLALLIIPALPAGLIELTMIRVVFDVIGHGRPLSPIEARMLGLAVGASREMVLWRACLISGVAALVALPYAAFMFGYAVWILQRISNLFRVNLYTRLQELSLRFHAEEKIGDAIFRMFQDSAAIPHVIDGLVIRPTVSLPLAAASLVWLTMFNYRIAAIAVVLIPANLALAWLYSARLRRAFLGEREATALATTRIEETLASINAVKAYGNEGAESGRYARDNWESFLAARRARLMLARYRVLSNTLRGVAYAGAVYLGARQVLAGGTTGLAEAAASLGLFQGVLAVFASMSVQTRNLTNLWGSLQDVAVATARVLEMLAKPSEERVTSGGRIPPSAPQSIAFERVSFGYDPRIAVLNDVSFEARAGEITAIAGASGSGKSTILALMVRFFELGAGRIAIDGEPIGDFDLAAWRGLLAVALQENPLFTASIRVNITYGRSDATDEQIGCAVERAGLGSFVASLPAGLETVLGEKGAKLSAGQAQRIGLARALLRDVPILLLDEPTSALDMATEEAVMRGVREWVNEQPRRRMAIIATHRRTTAEKADRVYRIAAGRIESGEQPVLAAVGMREA
jgi:ATP-binding cassette, subfamily B, bacterial